MPSSSKPGEVALVSKLPFCDIHGAPCMAVYDAKTPHGPWAFMCQEVFDDMKCELGLGRGQRLEVEE